MTKRETWLKFISKGTVRNLTNGGHAMKITCQSIRLEPMSQPTDDSLSDRLQGFSERVYREIKRKLYSGRKEDPKYVLKLKSMTTFSMQVSEGLHRKDTRGINSCMKFFLMKLWTVLSAQSGMSGS